ncbi:MAG: (2Fe-2S) ferredoxin domain-containing protein [Alphaproteobacteria bacterium]|nr:(2Fe-2S) ferredoxin domain-containing protein [Alphaproteobacteria bacterium]MBO6863319.1 (2Fe-2S) ferredoxin domain-containing protein [Alphaproteobacteria bacterium]
MTQGSLRLLVCVNPVGSNKPSCGGDRASEALATRLEQGIADRNLAVTVERIHCLNRCLRGPAMRIAPGGKFYLEYGEADIPRILDELAVEAGTAEDHPEEFDFGGSAPGS